MDALADDLLTHITLSGEHASFALLLKSLQNNDSYQPGMFSMLPETLAPQVEHYFASTSQLPAWADREKIALGQRLFSRYVPLVLFILQYKSLPLCYSCKNGAKILHLTGRLTQRYGKGKIMGRLADTAQMVIHAMSEGGFEPKGKGLATIQKVRLIHAMVRAYIRNPRQNPEGWDSTNLGEPINQEDMAGTLMSFAPVVLSGLEQLNVSISEQEREGYMHCWKIIGHLMGVDADLLPDSYEEGQLLATRILQHQAAPSQEGLELVQTCIGLPRKFTPERIFPDVHEYMVRYFLRDASEATGLDIGEIIGTPEIQNDYETWVKLFSRFAGIGILNRTMLKGYHTVHKIGTKMSRQPALARA